MDTKCQVLIPEYKMKNGFCCFFHSVILLNK